MSVTDAMKEVVSLSPVRDTDSLHRERELLRFEMDDDGALKSLILHRRRKDKLTALSLIHI